VAKDKFTRDLDRLLDTIRPTTHAKVMDSLVELRNRLVELRKKQLVKINHSVIELICAKHLIECGYQVTVEWLIDGGQLVADLFAVRPEGGGDANVPNSKAMNFNTCPEGAETLLVEAETGFVPPSAALSPSRYRQARIAAKIARYSGHSEKFALATPNYHILQVPQVLLRPPEMRDKKELQILKALVDEYYSATPIPIESLKKSELDSIYIVNVDDARVRQIAPHRYLDTILRAEGLIGRT
jgi:hypothetical protein